MTDAQQSATVSARYQAALLPLYRHGWLETQRTENMRQITALRETLR